MKYKCILRCDKTCEALVAVDEIVEVKHVWFNKDYTKQLVATMINKELIDIPVGVFNVCFRSIEL